MAIDLYSETSNTHNNITMSPRISFSHDLSQSDTIPVEQLLRTLSSSSSSSNIDFNFCVQQNIDHQHADELFSNGKIVPTNVKQQKRASQIPLPPQVNQNPPDQEQHNSSKSFWGFKRSSSCGNGYAGSICPIPLLSRSNSTGSSTSSSTKRSSSNSKEGFAQKHHHHHHHHHHHNYQKPPLRKTSYGYGNNGNTSNGVRVNPVLNLGFGSLFCSSKKK